METGGGGLVVNNLGEFFGDLERLGDQVRNVASDQHIRIEMKGIVLFSKLVGEGSSGGVGRGVPVAGEVGNGALGRSMALNVHDDWVSVAVLLFKLQVTDLYKAIYLVANVDVARNRDRVIGDVDVECNLGLQERSARCRGFGLVAQLEPLLRKKNAG